MSIEPRAPEIRGKRPTKRRRWTITLGVVAVGVAAAIAGPSIASPLRQPEPPNIVYVVVDDLSSNLIPYMTQVGQLADESVSFDDFYVTDSQCCPSRSSTFTGQYPHNTKVKTNGWPQGGWSRFVAEGHLTDTIGTQMTAAGYRTGYVGKFLNGYEPTGLEPRHRNEPELAPGFVPPGWDEWQVAGDGYKEFDYTLASAVDRPVADVISYGHDEDDYLTDVLSGKTTEFLERAATHDQPFYLQVAPFSVHSRVGRDKAFPDKLDFPPAPRDRAEPRNAAKWPSIWAPPDKPDGDCGPVACSSIQYPVSIDSQGFGTLPQNPPTWMPKKPIKPSSIPRLREQFLDRVRMAQSVDDLVGTLRQTLDRLGLSDNTYVVFTSDNGYHLGELGLRRGKNTAYDFDVRVPFYVMPPGGTQGRTVDAFAQNTDLMSTFLDLAGRPGLAHGSDGRSLAPLIQGGTAGSSWRQGALIEYTRDEGKDNPDNESAHDPPSYRAVRTADYLYVDYGERQDEPGPRYAEFYDLQRDPGATINRFKQLGPAERRELDQALDRYARCSGPSCLTAGANLPDIHTTGR